MKVSTSRYRLQRNAKVSPAFTPSVKRRVMVLPLMVYVPDVEERATLFRWVKVTRPCSNLSVKSPQFSSLISLWS